MPTNTWSALAPGNWSTDANWSLGHAPAAGEDVVFDATSTQNCAIDVATNALNSLTFGGTGSIYSGTVTSGIAQVNSWGAITFQAGTTATLNLAGFAAIFGSLAMSAGTLTAGASAIEVRGSWNMNAASAVFNCNTSSVTFTNTATITCGSVGSAQTGSNRAFFAISIGAAGTTTTVASLFFAWGLTTLGTGTVNGAGVIDIKAALVTPLVNAGATISCGITYDLTASVLSVNIAGMSSTGPCTMACTAVGAVFNLTLLGSFSCGPLSVGIYNGNSTVNLFTADYPLTATSLNLGENTGAGRNSGVLHAGNSIVTITGNVTISAFNPSSAIIAAASGAWSVSGAWSDGSTSSLWSFAAPITFNSATSRTMKWGLSSSFPSQREFDGNVTLDPASGVANPTFTSANNALVVGGTLTVRNSIVGGTCTLTDSVSNLGISCGGVLIDARGTIVMGSATLTDGGDWSSAAGTFTVGSGTVRLTGSVSAYITVNAILAFNNLTIESTVLAITLMGNLLVTGTYAGAFGNLLTLASASSQTITAPGIVIGQIDITGAGTKIFTTSFTARDMIAVVPCQVTLTAGITWSISGDLTGPSGGLLTLRSSAAGTPWNLSAYTGRLVTAVGIDVEDSTSTGGLLVIAYDPSNVDSGNNTNWLFTKDVSVLASLLLTSKWIAANTDGITPTITSIYSSTRELRAQESDFVLIYAMPASERKQGVDYDFVFVSQPLSIDIRVGRSASGLSDDAAAIRSHAIRVRDEARRILYSLRRGPGGGYDEVRYIREHDLSDRMRRLFRWTIDTDWIKYADPLPTSTPSGVLLFDTGNVGFGP